MTDFADMGIFAALNTAQQIASLSDCVAGILAGFDLGEAEFESINHEYNSTFKVTTSAGQRYALRINVNSKRSLANLNAELFMRFSIAGLRGRRSATNLSPTNCMRPERLWHSYTSGQMIWFCRPTPNSLTYRISSGVGQTIFWSSPRHSPQLKSWRF
jgi:hypothetical protein